MFFTTKTYVKRSIERLYGIIQGIDIDCHINDREIVALKKWLDTHDVLHHEEPFRDLVYLVSEILEDGVVDADERKLLSEWCSNALNETGFLGCVTQSTRRLHGILSGIVCDGQIRAEELTGLQDWLLDYEQMKDWWPFNELKKLLDQIMADGKVDPEEQEALRDFFSSFTEQVIDDPKIFDNEYWMDPRMISLSPVFKSISTICEPSPVIRFNGKEFCFTGPAASGKRSHLAAAVEQLGGVHRKNPVISLDYLVIGAQSSPAWVYSTYGRKIEAVKQRKETVPDCQTQIVKEADFVSAVTARGLGF
ncbi:hypothetical protein [Desulfotignum balticum]|uniref:hypothetical protein n=1 Tax=Desulfotignum balticum TaxID=115781 RepID=UPI0004057DBD|nr:hypothetical protein [Desulfotignum balticum]